MKLFKLSLAAVVAAGALSSVSAAPLEEAIKDIDVSGFGRYRFESNSYKYTGSVKTPAGGYGSWDEREHDSFHRFTLDVNFKATLDDNFFAVIGLRYDSRDTVGSHAYANSGISNTHGGLGDGVNGGWGGAGKDSFSVRQYYVGFTAIPYTTVLFGRQPAGTFFTDDIVATGLKVAVNPVEGLTLAGLFYTNLEEDGDLGGISFAPTFAGGEIVANENPYIHQKNLWGLAAIYQNEMLDLQAWYAGLNKVANLFALSAGVNYGIDDDISVRGKVQWAHTSPRGKFKDNYRVDANGDSSATGKTLVSNSNFIGFDLGASFYGFDIDAGYIQYGKKDKRSVHTLEDKGSLIYAGEILTEYTGFGGKHKVWFGKVGYTYDAYSIGVEYLKDKVKNDIDPNENNHEWVIRAGYKYNDKLSFKAYYAMSTTKESSYEEIAGVKYNKETKDRHNRFRFDAVYNF